MVAARVDTPLIRGKSLRNEESGHRDAGSASTNQQPVCSACTVTSWRSLRLNTRAVISVVSFLTMEMQMESAVR